MMHFLHLHMHTVPSVITRMKIFPEFGAMSEGGVELIHSWARHLYRSSKPSNMSAGRYIFDHEIIIEININIQFFVNDILEVFEY